MLYLFLQAVSCLVSPKHKAALWNYGRGNKVLYNNYWVSVDILPVFRAWLTAYGKYVPHSSDVRLELAWKWMWHLITSLAYCGIFTLAFLRPSTRVTALFKQCREAPCQALLARWGESTGDTAPFTVAQSRCERPSVCQQVPLFGKRDKCGPSCGLSLRPCAADYTEYPSAHSNPSPYRCSAT